MYIPITLDCGLKISSKGKVTFKTLKLMFLITSQIVLISCGW